MHEKQRMVKRAVFSTRINRGLCHSGLLIQARLSLQRCDVKLVCLCVWEKTVKQIDVMRGSSWNGRRKTENKFANDSLSSSCHVFPHFLGAKGLLFLNSLTVGRKAVKVFYFLFSTFWRVLSDMSRLRLRLVGSHVAYRRCSEGRGTHGTLRFLTRGERRRRRRTSLN